MISLSAAAETKRSKRATSNSNNNTRNVDVLPISFLLIGVIRFKSSGVAHAVRLLFAPSSARNSIYYYYYYALSAICISGICSMVSHHSSHLSVCLSPSSALCCMCVYVWVESVIYDTVKDTVVWWIISYFSCLLRLVQFNRSRRTIRAP